MFLTLLVVGLVGLAMMAIPALGGHGHASALHGHLSPLGHATHAQPVGPHPIAKPQDDTIVVADAAPERRQRLIPSPRAIFSLLALYGAFGNALVQAGHRSLAVAALVALVPAFLVERYLMRPLFSLVFRFQARPSSSLDALILADAQAVVPFRNGRGIVSIKRDGRLVQLVARLRPDQAGIAVAVGDHLLVEAVDTGLESVTVSIISNPTSP